MEALKLVIPGKRQNRITILGFRVIQEAIIEFLSVLGHKRSDFLRQ